LDLVLLQEAQSTFLGKFGIGHFIFFGIQAKVVGRTEIGLFQVTVFEERVFKITGIEYSFGQVGLRKIDRNHFAIMEEGILQFQFIKRRQVQGTIIKIEGQQKIIAMVKMDTQKFTAFKDTFLKGGVF
jgi:hypothetical protein